MLTVHAVGCDACGKPLSSVLSENVHCEAVGHGVGINNDLIQSYVKETRKTADNTIGVVVHCTNEEVFRADFFPYYDDKKSAVTDTFCQPGDLVCIDEAWRFWGTDSKLLKEHKSFFLEHGHFVHPSTGVACDLVLMIQDMSTLHRFLRTVVAFSFRTHKKVSLGMSNTYSVNMWEGSKMTRATMIGSWVRKYNKAIFPLYSSFKGGAEGKTVNVDSRQNILASKSLWFIAAAVIGLGGVSIYGVKRFFAPTKPPGIAMSKVDSSSAVAAAGSASQANQQKTSDVSELGAYRDQCLSAIKHLWCWLVMVTESRESQTRDGLSFLPRLFDTKGAENSRSEILLVLQVQRL